MAKSYYKAPWIGKQPMCAICGGAGEGPRAEHHLTHGVSVWLCAAHRSDEFQRRRAGRDFVASLQAVWGAAGIRTKRHGRALTAHLRRVRSQPTTDLPGSYAWPTLRREAERRWAGGEPPRTVIDHLRGLHEHNPFNVPSIRTMRRWFTEARWLQLKPPPRARRQPISSALDSPRPQASDAQRGRPRFPTPPRGHPPDP